MLSINFKNVYINSFNAIIGPNELKGNITGVKNSIKDFYNESKTFEQGQIKMQKDVILDLLNQNNLTNKDIDLIVGGDLSNQITCTCYALNNLDISFLGLYSACSTFIEALIISSVFVDKNILKKVAAITSSHNLVAERQFRYPVEYGALKNKNSTFTATASVACLISNKRGKIKIQNATIGTIKELGVKDPNYIGAIMAPICGDVIYNHLINQHKNENYYDLILTGDLGNVGVKILKDYLKEEYNLVLNNITDAGASLYNKIEEINDGASGPCALPLYFFYNIIRKRKYKKVLLVGTGSLHSKTMVNQGMCVPSIAHAIEIEVL